MTIRSKNHILTVPILFFFSTLLLMETGCKDDKKYDMATLTTGSFSNITETSITCAAEVTNEGSFSVTAKGFCWNTTGGPYVTTDSISNDGDGKGAYTTEITGLTPSTLYFIRAYATNKAGTKYGELRTFWTLGKPVSKTDFPVDVKSTEAVIGGKLIYDGGESITGIGLCYGTNESPSLSDNVLTYTGVDSAFTFTLTGLTPGTTYYFCTYATNSKGTSYGNVRMFNTMDIGVADVDGNIYDVIQLGNRLWFASNLKVTKFNNSVDIPNLSDSLEWSQTTSPAWCYYKNSSSYGDDYGVLYNWYAANNNNLCPTGWHVPTDAEWEELDDFLGVDAGNKIKIVDDDYWITIDGATNESNFCAIGSGYRMPNGDFRGIRRDAEWWTSDATEGSYVTLWEVTASSSGIARSTTQKNRGVSVRCVKEME